MFQPDVPVQPSEPSPALFSFVPPFAGAPARPGDPIWAQPDPWEEIWPPAPTTVAEAGIPATFLEDLLLKHLVYGGPSSIEDLSNRTGLSFEVIDELISELKSANQVEISSAAQFGELSYRFRLTDRGEQRAQDALNRSAYASFAPVTLDQYVPVVRQQSLRQNPPSPSRILSALSQFVMSPAVRDNVARALHSGRATLIFGSSGNGKTAIIEQFARHADDTVIIPYALYVHGQLVRIFDAAVHTPTEQPADDYDPGIFKAATRTNGRDKRWVEVRRPVVVVGGELTQEALELSFDPVARFYQAPPHLKAQDGVFVVDDFGRQRIRPEELLNRWILPMERGDDLLTLHSGENFSVPFEIALMFSTNLQPADLVDEAFLRRIPYKVNLPSPNPEQFKEITRRVCGSRKVEFSEDTLDYLVERLYHEDFPFEPRGAYPRDIAQLITDSARFDGVPVTLSRELIDRALNVYFIE